MNKTLIGKNNILFLNNDSCKELEVHCNNLDLVNDKNLSNYSFHNFFIFVFPNKSLIYKDYLPDKYKFKYRPALEIYKNKFKQNLFDLYEILKNEQDVYYKTDTHINLKGNYIVYKFFIDFLNKKLNMNIIARNIELKLKTCELSSVPYGIGDLTWKTNLGDQILNEKNDNFYYNEYTDFYNTYKIQDEKNIRFLNYELIDETKILENQIAHWNIILKYIMYKNNNNNNTVPFKVLIFYDSFLLNILPLYLELFKEVYLIKSVYNNKIINLIKPDYIFEFRVERFLF